VAAGPLILSGCIGADRGLDGAQSPDARPRIAARAGRPGVVVSAPPGAADAHAGEIAAAIARRTGFGLVVASEFMSEGDTPPEAHDLYARHVREVAQGPLDLYVEVHGATPAGTAWRIEIATAGIDRELARRLRTLAELIRDAHLLAHPEAPRLDIAVQPADEADASGAPPHGVVTARQALRLQLPRAALVDFADVYTAILADFLTQALSLPPAR
jgi:hypothetical protein